MTSHRTTIKVFSGNSNPELAEQIANQLHLPLGKAEGKFPVRFRRLYAVMMCLSCSPRPIRSTII